ncbi:Os07g0291400, partial [Oryza sativa Japonica Group]
CHRPISLPGASQAKSLRHQLRLAEVILFFPFPLSLHLKISRHHHLLLLPELSSCRHCSGHPSLSLRLPPPSPGARRSGTPSPTGVLTSRPPESRCLACPPLCYLSAAKQKKKKRRTRGRRRGRRRH